MKILHCFWLHSEAKWIKLKILKCQCTPDAPETRYVNNHTFIYVYVNLPISKLLPISLAYTCIQVIHMIHDTSYGGIISGQSHAHDTASAWLCVLDHPYVPELPEALMWIVEFSYLCMFTKCQCVPELPEAPMGIVRLSYTCMRFKYQCVLELLEEPIIVVYAYAFQIPMCGRASGSTYRSYICVCVSMAAW